MRSFAIVVPMDNVSIPNSSLDLANLIVTGVRETYDLNSLRFDELVGDDGVTFGFCIYRNVWYRIEQDLLGADDWKTSRPDGSLVITGKGCRIHIYRHGQNEAVELDRFRLDDAKSYTKKSIAQNNGQMKFDLATEEVVIAPANGFLELVIVHAGNPDDGCCGIWLGIPAVTEHSSQSPWVEVRPLWLIDRAVKGGSGPDASTVQPRHDELPEPTVIVEVIEPEEPSAGEA